MRALWVLALAACVPPPLTLDEDGGADGSFSDAGTSSYRAVVLADSPLHYWRFGEDAGTTAFDEVGDASGTYVGAFAHEPGAIANDPNTAVVLNPASQSTGCVLFQVLSDIDFTGTQPFTLEAWVKGTVDANYRRIFFREDSNKSHGYDLVVTNAQTNITFQRYGAGDSGLTAAGTPVEDLSSFRYVVAVYDGTQLTEWVDGVMMNSQPDPTPAASVDAALDIGCDPSVPATFFQGAIDEAAIYGYALTNAKIQAHYAAGK